MARKRPAKRRKQSQKSIDQTQTTGQSHPDASTPVPPPARHSSDDGTLSETAMSEGAQTAMTSFMDTDEETQRADPPAINTATTSEPDSEDEHDHDPAYDVVSVYPRSHYPQVSFEHRSEHPYRGAETFGGSDM